MPKILYPDSAIIQGILNLHREGKFQKTNLYQNLKDGTWLLGISWVHIIENEKQCKDNYIEERLELISYLEGQKWLKYLAHPHLMLIREALYYSYRYFDLLEDKRVFVPSFGQIFVDRVGNDREGSPMDEPVKVYMQERTLIKSKFDELNSVLDKYVDYFNNQRNALLDRDKKNEPYSFYEYLTKEELLKNNYLEQEQKAKIINMLIQRKEDDDMLRKKFLFHWAMYSLMKKISMSNKNFEVGDIRDILHASYTPYVDLITADGGTCSIIDQEKWPDEWRARIIKNADFRRDYLSESK